MTYICQNMTYAKINLERMLKIKGIRAQEKKNRY